MNMMGNYVIRFSDGTYYKWADPYGDDNSTDDLKLTARFDLKRAQGFADTFYGASNEGEYKIVKIRKVKTKQITFQAYYPTGKYGVWCESRRKCHQNENSWLLLSDTSFSGTYDEAVKRADEMCRSNKFFHYYAKPLESFL